MGEWCRRRDPRTRQPAEATSRGVCLACERHGEFVIMQLPGDWFALSSELAKPLVGFSTAEVRVKQVEAPLVLRVEIDEAMRRIVWALETWEIEVRRRVKLSAIPEGRCRPHATVLRAADLLANHYSALLALEPVKHVAYSGALEVGDGLDAIAELVGVHHRSRLLTGESRVWEKRRVPCPPPVLNERGELTRGGGCGQETLGEWIGEGTLGHRIIQCSNCGWQCTIEQYSTYVTTFIPPDRRVA